jgi:hypothetical protein
MAPRGCLTCCCVLIMFFGALLLLGLHGLRMARAQDPHLNPACQAIPNMPPAEKMSLPRRQARQRLYRSRVRPGQPTLDELLASESSFNPQRSDVSVTAILNHWSRHTICKQIDGLRAQTFPPTYIWVCLFASPMADQIRAAVRAYNDSRISLIEAEYNFKYFGRFQLALAAQVRLGRAQLWVRVSPQQACPRRAPGTAACTPCQAGPGHTRPSPRAGPRLTSAHPHLCSPSPLLTFTSAHPHLCSAQTSHVLVLDDDMLPGSRYLQQLLHVIHSPRRRGLLGSIGWLLPRPNQELRFGSYRSLANDSGGLCVLRPLGGLCALGWRVLHPLRRLVPHLACTPLTPPLHPLHPL